VTDDDLRQVIRDFRTSVSTDLTDQHRRLDEMGNEFRQRITTAEMTVINEIRSLADRLDRRLGRIETRLNDLEGPQT
jgi:hypothetical protein